MGPNYTKESRNIMYVTNEKHEQKTTKVSLVSSSSSTSSSPEQKRQRVLRYSSISDNNDKKKKQKQVRFASADIVKSTISINDMTEQEIQNTWLQQHEQHLIRLRCRELVRSCNCTLPAGGSNNSNNEYEETYYRGLESYVKHGKQRKEMNRLEAMMLVLEEQQEQYFQAGSIYDEEKIAFAYKEVSVECQFEAELRAVQDQKEIEKEIIIYSNDNSNSSSNSNSKNSDSKSKYIIIKSAVTSASTTTTCSSMSPASISKTTIVSAAA